VKTETKTKAAMEPAPEPVPLTTALAPRGFSEVAGAEPVPEFLQTEDYGQEGLERIDEQDITMPRIVICQSGTPQRKKSDPRYIEGMQEGDFFNNVTSEIYGPAVKITPVLVYRSRIQFKPMADGGGIVCRSLDDDRQCPLNSNGPCTRGEWHGDEPPECTLFYNYIVMLHPSGQPAALSFKSSGITAAKNLNAMMKLRKDRSGRPVPAFAGAYLVTAKEKTNDKGTFFVPVVTPAGWSTQGQFSAGKSLYNGLHGKTINIEMHENEDGTGAAESEEM